jgi:hypothetical protein
MSMQKSQAVLETHRSRREFFKKAAYATPFILTLAATPAFTAKGSKDSREKNKEKDKGPKG